MYLCDNYEITNKQHNTHATMKRTLHVLPIVAAAASLVACTDESKPTNRPNILFVFVDDMGYGDVGFNGSCYYETPAIDSVAAQSVVFQNSYTYPTSSPSRTALMTGQQSFRTGVYNVPVLETFGDSTANIFSRWTVTKDFPFYSEQLTNVGYRSIHIGKWHVVGPYPDEELAMTFPIAEHLTQPDPADFSWVERHKSPDIKNNFYPEGRGYVKNVGGTYRGDPALCENGYKNPSGGYFPPFLNPFIEEKSDDEWLTDRLTDEAIAFMQENKDEPFFINLHYYTIHAPVRSRSQELEDKYVAKEGDPTLGQGLAKGNRHVHEAGLASMIESLDDNFARMMNFLKESGLDKNTIIVFSSDNGYNAGENLQLRGRKMQIYEGGVRVPTFIRWADNMNPRRTEVPISILDFFPTFLEMAGIHDYDGVLDGESLVPLLKEDKEELKERPIYWQLNSANKTHGTCTAMRLGDYKLIQFLATGDVELYNLKRDPKESTNLVDVETDVATEMIAQMVAWRKANNVPLPPNAVVE